MEHHHFKNGKPSISMGHLYHGKPLNNGKGIITNSWCSHLQGPFQLWKPREAKSLGPGFGETRGKPWDFTKKSLEAPAEIAMENGHL